MGSEAMRAVATYGQPGRRSHDSGISVGACGVLVGSGVSVGACGVLVGACGVSVGACGVLVGGGSVGLAVGGGSVGLAVGGTAVRVGGTAVRVGGTAVRVGGTAVRVGGTAVRVGSSAVRVGGTGVLIGSGALLIGPAVLIGAEVGGMAVGAGVPATGDLVGTGVLPVADFVGVGTAVAAGLAVADGLTGVGFLLLGSSALLALAVALALTVCAAAGALVLPVPIAAGTLVVVALGAAPLVAAGFKLGGAVDSAASAAPLTNGTGVARMNWATVGCSAATSVGSSRSWLASPDCSAFGSNPGLKNEPPDAPEERVSPSSGAYGPAAKFVTLGESSSNSPSVTNMAARQTPTIIPFRMLGRTGCPSLRGGGIKTMRCTPLVDYASTKFYRILVCILLFSGVSA